MTQFEQYIKKLAIHEDERNRKEMNPREIILVNSGISMNRIGDFIANPKIKFKKISVPLEKVLFTSTNPDWNKILIKKCQRKVELFRQLINKDEELKNKISQDASFGNEPVLLHGPDESGNYRPFDGMHRIVGAVIKNRKVITAYVPVNIEKHPPICEPHIIYDLIRAYQKLKNTRNEQSLINALVLLGQYYDNVPNLLKQRFDKRRVLDKDVQKIITKTIAKIKK